MEKPHPRVNPQYIKDEVFYGDDLPTPEQIRKDPNIPWVKVLARASGKTWEFEIKTLAPVRWRAAGEMDLRMVVIRPIGYRLRKGARRLYTKQQTTQ